MSLFSLAREAIRLAVPVECPGCGLIDVTFCEECQAALWESPQQVAQDNVWSIGAYEGVLQSILIEWKEGGRRDLDRHLAWAMSSAVQEMSIPFDLVVPIPSSLRSTQRRGTHIVKDLAAAVAASQGAQCQDLLRRVPGVRDQVGLGRAERMRNAHGSMRIRRRQLLHMGSGSLKVLLVDDIVTTGSTLIEASRVLRENGVQVTGSLVVAATRHGSESCYP